MRLETERLVLRPWEERDREPLIALQTDPEVRRFCPTVTAGDFDHPRVPPDSALRPHVLYRIVSPA